ncbi:MerR family transcriptional regulator [Diaminobutyricimonas sp. LJ205]|uniref:MerR family transcriptional regulator n=1 Tax=Diaminobutyricimonas sp. LJ205 TaxID=2683590 RepID=UPI0012F4BF5B|nr:MerR family transcriptional regulator [Diaminobutyricimonas sp. LJ205]
MRISELSTLTGVPIATIKYYLREGLLQPGASTSATQASYGKEHARRIGLIRALTDVVGVSVASTRLILKLIEQPTDDLFETLGRAIGELPPQAPELDDYPRARAAIERVGWFYDPRYAAVAQLERALAAAESAGLPLSPDRLEVYAEQLHGIADYDIAQLPADNPIQYAVLGTALYEPVLAALRRLAHQDVMAKNAQAR